MNIQERNQYIGLHNQLMDLGKLNNDSTAEFINANEYWNRLNRPPLYQYIPNYVFVKLHEYLNNKRLYNRPKERFQLTNDLLEPIGLKPLASGTNRRTFYCVYDPHIVFKLASDSVGMSDNLNEYTMQKLLKPFFAKMFSVTPDGLISLSERVETMTEKDYKIIWSEYIFKIINDLLSRGYIMEDIGSNFFKNWGIRIGYGPVLLDCPYIYKVDTKKLKCTKINRQTGEICNGNIDYNYEKGMSEIICTKCGTRYYASELAEIYPSESFTKIIRGRDYKMSIIDTNVKVQVTKGDQVVNRYFVETDSQEYSNNQGPRRVTVDEFNPKKSANVQSFPHVQTNIHSVVTNVTNNIPVPEINGTSVYNINDYPTNYNLFGIDIPNTLLNTIKTNCNIDFTKLSENELYNYLTKNTTQDFWISNMSSEEYKIFSEFSSKFVNNYITNKSLYILDENGNSLINIFGAYIYKSILTKLEKHLNLKINEIPDVNVLYNQLTTKQNKSVIKSILNETEYNTFKIFIGNLTALNIDKITFLNSTIPSFAYDLVKLCNKPINKLLYQKLEKITNLNFSTIEDNKSLAKYLIDTKDQISSYLSNNELSQFQFFILSISSFDDQNEISIQQEKEQKLPEFKQEEPKDQVTQQQENQIQQIEEPKDQIIQQQKNQIQQIEEPKDQVIQQQEEKQEDLNLDENGNTLGIIADWTEYYRDYKKYTLYPKDIKNEIIYFLKKIETKFDYNSAEFLANKLQVKYIKLDEYENKDQVNLKTIKIPEVLSDTKRVVQKQDDKSSNSYSIPTQDNQIEQSQKMINPETDWKTRESEVPIEKTVEIDPNKTYFVEKAKTAEELSALAEKKLENDNSVIGIIGESKVDSLRNKELIPVLKNKIFNRFNNLKLENNVDVQMKDLQILIKHYVFDDLKLITRDDGSGIDIVIKRSADERNRDCFKVYVNNNNATIFEVVLYPERNDSIENQKTIRERYSENDIINELGFNPYEFINNETELNTFLNQKLQEYDLTKLNTVEEAKKILISYLYSVLVDKVKGKVSSSLILRKCTDYVINQCQISENNEKPKEEPAFTPANQDQDIIADQI